MSRTYQLRIWDCNQCSNAVPCEIKSAVVNKPEGCPFNISDDNEWELAELGPTEWTDKEQLGLSCHTCGRSCKNESSCVQDHYWQWIPQQTNSKRIKE